MLARVLHEGTAPVAAPRPQRALTPAPADRVAAVTRLEIERARFRAHASTLHARLATSRLFESGELAELRAELVDAVAAIDAAAGCAILAGRDRTHLPPIRR